MVVLGTALPIEAPAVKDAFTPLIGAGAALTAAALIFPRLKSVDFAGIFKAELTSGEAGQRRLRADVWKLQRFAWLVCGDATDARDLVEEALAETRLAKVSGGEQGAYALQSLVVLLENAREHAWLRRPSAEHGAGSRLADSVVSDQCRPTMEALARLPVRVRMEYLLHCSWLLSLDEVVKIFGCAASEVSEAVMQGREALKAAQ
jgi:DNA-directed RNA polymerase specialized sigma24 family protein